MTSTGSSGPEDPGPGRRKRPAPPTLDLTAQEVATSAATEPAAPEPGASEPAAAADVASAPTDAAAPSEPSSLGAASEPHEATADPAPATSAPEEQADSAAAPPPEDAPETPEPPAPPGNGIGAARAWVSPLSIFTVAAVVVLLVAAAWFVVAARREAKTAQRLAALEARMGELAARPAAGDARQSADLAARIAAVEPALKRLESVDTRLAKIESTPPPPGPAVPPAGGDHAGDLDSALTVLTERLTAMEATVKSLGERPAAWGTVDKAATDRLAALEATVKSLGERAAAVGAVDQLATERLAASEGSLQALNGRLADLAARVGEATAAARAAESKAAAAESKAAAADSKAAAAQDASRDRALRLAFVTGALRDAVARGDPFAGELAAVKALGADPAKLAPLEPFATTGVPGAAALAREFDSGVAPALRAAAAPKPEAAPPASDGGVLARLQASAERLVRIRPINAAPAGDDAAAMVARSEAAARRGDIDGALAELEKLPDAVRTPAAAWVKRAQARRAALAAASGLAGNAAAALAKD